MLPREWIDFRAQEQLAAALVNTEGAKALLDLAQADEVLRQDYADRFVYELLQNASDAQRKYAREAGLLPDAPGRVAFELHERWLLVANDGAPFSHEPDPGQSVSSIEAFTRIGESTKRHLGYAGNKGIGSRSVYEVCDRIRVVSGAYRLLFDADRLDGAIRAREGGSEDARDLLLHGRRRVPMLRVAFWDEDIEDEIDQAVRALRDGGFATVLALRLRRDYSVEGLVGKLRQIGAPELVLLGNVGLFRFVHAAKSADNFELRLETQEGGVAVVHTPEGSPRFRVFREDDGFEAARVAVELSEDGHPVPISIGRQVFHTFYPVTGSRHCIPLILHGYFKLTPDRKDLAREEHNRIVFEQLTEVIASQVAPAIMPGAEGTDLCDILLPTTAGEGDERTIWETFKEDQLPQADLLCAWFRWRLCRRLADVAFLRDSQGKALAPRGLPIAASAAALADDLAPALRLHAGHARLSRLPAPIQTALGLVTLTPAHLEALLPLIGATPVQAGRVLRLLLTLDPRADFAARLRARRTPVLPAHDGSLQPLPGPEDLFMIRVPRNSAESGQDDDEVEPSVPSFIDAWQLHPDVLADAQVTAPAGPGALREEWVKTLLLKEFRVDDLLEGLMGVWIGNELTPAFLKLDEGQRKALLRMVIDLVVPNWFGAAIRAGELPQDPTPWFAFPNFDPLRDRGGWRRSHLVSRCPLPLADGSWVPAHKLVLGGSWNRLAGFDPGAAYEGTDVGVLSPVSEAPWLQQHLDQLLRQRTEAARRNQPGLAALDAEAFRQFVYLRLGAHGDVAVSAVHNKGGVGRWPAQQLARSNPHFGVADARWSLHTQRIADSIWASYWTHTDTIWCVRSVALAWQDHLVHWHERQKRHFLPAAIVQRLRVWGKDPPQDAWRSPGSQGQTTSLLMEQLRETALWLDSRCTREHRLGGLWYTPDLAPMIEPAFHQRARFAPTVTGRCLEPSDARYLGLPRIDEPSAPELLRLLAAVLDDLPTAEAARSPGHGLLVLLQDLYCAAAGLVYQGKMSIDKLCALGVPCVAHTRQGPALRRVFPTEETVYYDDEDLRIASLSREVPLAWLPERQEELARRLHLVLLSEADLQSVEPLGDWEHEESALLEELMRLKPAMFAFLCHAAFLPASSQLQIDSDVFRERWAAWSREALDVEILPRLHLRLGTGREFEAFDKSHPCLLLPRKGAGRVIMVQGRDDQVPPLESLAPALARLLGVRQHQLTVQMLLRRWAENSEDFVDQILVGELGVARSDYERLADMVLETRERRERNRQAIQRLLAAAGLPQGDEALLDSTPDDPETLRWVRDHGALARWAQVAEAASIVLQTPQTAREVFVEQRDAWKVAAICAVVAASGALCDVRIIQSRYAGLGLQQQPAELRFDPDGGATALQAALEGFLREYGAELPAPGEHPEAFLARTGASVHDAVFPGISENVSAVHARFLPLVVALVVGTQVDRDRIVAAAAEYGTLRTDGTLPELRVEIESYLATHAELPPTAIQPWLARFPLLPLDAPDSILLVKGGLAKVKQQQDDHLDLKVREYTTNLHRLLGDLTEEARSQALAGAVPALAAPPEAPSPLDSPPADREAPRESAPIEPSPPEPKPTVTRDDADQDDPYERYRVQAEHNALTGRRGEAFALICTLHAWQRLAQVDPAAARQRLEELAACWQGLAPERMESLRGADPTTWTTEGRAMLEALLRVGGTSMENDRRGFDLFGLSPDLARVVRVEVKASTGVHQEGFLLTENELRVAGLFGRDYEIWHVRGVRGGLGVRVPTRLIYPDPAALVRDGKLVTDTIVRQVRPYRADATRS